MTKRYGYSLLGIILVSMLIFSSIKAVELFDRHPFVVGSLIALPSAIGAGAHAVNSTIRKFCGMEEESTIYGGLWAPLSNHIFINYTFSKPDSKKKALQAAALTNVIMHLFPFICLVVTDRQFYTKAFMENKYPMTVAFINSLIGSAYMLYVSYKSVQTTAHDKQKNKADKVACPEKVSVAE